MLVSDELSLPEFVKRYKNEFPVRVRVCKGFYGATNRTSVSEGDMFNIHFLKNTKVRTCGAGERGRIHILLEVGVGEIASYPWQAFTLLTVRKVV